MKTIRMMLAGAALVVLASLSAAATPRWGDPQYGTYNQNSGAYQQGYNDALNDARQNRNQVSRPDRYGNGADRAAYDQGYRDGRQAYANQTGVYPNQNGYPQQYPNTGVNGQYPGQYPPGNNGHGRGWGWGGHDRNNGGYGSTGQYGGYGGQNAAQLAQQYGYQDGVNEGANDRQTGHSFRPTQDRGYQQATNGYRGQLGVSKDQYRQWYRQGYQQGYQQGYNGNGYRR